MYTSVAQFCCDVIEFIHDYLTIQQTSTDNTIIVIQTMGNRSSAQQSNNNTYNTTTSTYIQSQQLANASANQSPHSNTTEPAECTACSDYKQHNITNHSTNNNTTQQSCLAYSHSGCPLSRAEVGRAAWAYLHTVAAYYPIKPTPQQQQHMTQFMTEMCYTYPCNYCADETIKHINKSNNHPSLHCTDRNTLSLWLCDVHNEVNQRMGKSLFDCNYVIQRWRTGPPDGSCD